MVIGIEVWWWRARASERPVMPPPTMAMSKSGFGAEEGCREGVEAWAVVDERSGRCWAVWAILGVCGVVVVVVVVVREGCGACDLVMAARRYREALYDQRVPLSGILATSCCVEYGAVKGSRRGTTPSSGDQ